MRSKLRNSNTERKEEENKEDMMERIDQQSSNPSQMTDTEIIRVNASSPKSQLMMSHQSSSLKNLNQT